MKDKVVVSIWLFTVVVFALVILLHELPAPDNAPGFVSVLPAVNAGINGTCFLVLIASLVAIKSKNVDLHKKLNTAAMLLSVVFLLSYVTNHYFSGDVSYAGENKGLYLFILISHIVLAGISLPFILLSFYHGLQGRIEKHRKLVRFVYPIWLYVTLTGVMVFLFLQPYY